ncbi:hypothetical protein GUITHDRAFT_109483 [Guillardia theta CCMP2712]|uniref:Peptidase A1 domain-containing protein n=1 Tax=Guillardia theta (strain CCMP2712) TaxID=905079 RepID=L1J9F9_GUITC|nr:hypothetical protein GUITHDRAFT_109483 [Guillardia theta CCMP2712]EKX44705.1 hypothetical protein GUITHDRAFT_109483 [Guillardia theta CCMP2712]|eukprot:XP_005831685.1 hypothetical protein GUITHDRAFT_109483 [Guillardia theta CCMP2712]
MFTRTSLLALVVLLNVSHVRGESKNCDPKKDSGCNKFIRPFYPHECWAAYPGGPNCTRQGSARMGGRGFDPTKSKSIRYIKHGQFFLQYADNSNLKGYEATDIVQFGDFYTVTKFGGITTCNSPDFQRVNGILGFGLPQQMPMELPGMPSPQLPLPLLFDLTDPRVKDNAKNHMLRKRAFSFFSTDDQAEIQLGGVDPESIIGKMHLTTTIQPNDYAVPVHSIKFGDVELLQFSNPNLKVPIGCQGDECHPPFLAGILDSGTSCLVLPDAPVPGMLSNKPFTQWKHMIGGNTKAPKKHDTFHVNIAGTVYDIPFSDWYITQGSDSDQSCVQRMPGGMPMVLVGDVLFRRYVVMFDLSTFPGPVTIGIGKRNPNYKLATKHETISKITAHKQPAQVNHESTQYFVNVSIGTPRQKMPVIFDTGSSVFGVFSKCMSENVAADIGLPGIQCDFGQASEKTLLDRKDILDPVHLKEKRKAQLKSLGERSQELRAGGPKALLQTGEQSSRSESSMLVPVAFVGVAMLAVMLVKFRS